MTCPSEDFEHITFLRGLALRGITPTGGPRGYVAHIANETASKAQGIRNKRMGVSPGFPDFVVAIDRRPARYLELKRREGGKVSDAQQAWILVLGAQVVYGADHALSVVDRWLEEGEHVR